MHERMLDKLNTPTQAELAEWCGECETLYSDLLGFMTIKWAQNRRLDSHMEIHTVGVRPSERRKS